MSSKQYFDSVATNWDSMRSNFFQKGVRERAILEANIEDNSIIGDIGAGSGFISEGLVKLNVKIIAIDQSQNMLDVMQEKFHEFTNIEYKIGASENLPLHDSLLDYAFANMFLHHVESPQKTINEIFRVLKPGGALIITDLDKHNYNFLKEEHNDRWMGFEREDIKNWFISSGFTDVMIDCIGENCCTSSQENDETVVISIFIAKGIKAYD